MKTKTKQSALAATSISLAAVLLVACGGNSGSGGSGGGSSSTSSGHGGAATTTSSSSGGNPGACKAGGAEITTLPACAAPASAPVTVKAGCAPTVDGHLT